MENNLLWDKYNPTTLEELILLPRIRESFKDGISNHPILHGHFGTGKSTLASILTDGKPTLKRNTSYFTSVEILRNDITNFIEKMSMFDSSDGMKYVYLEEFEKASESYQEALKAFMDDYRKRIRFIFTTNHIHKVNGGIISRGMSLDFNPNGSEEISYLKQEYAKRLVFIAKSENITIGKDDIKRIVVHNFPDIRHMINVLQHIKETGKIEFSDKVYNFELQKELFDLITTKKDMITAQHFIMDNFGAEKVHDMLVLCGRPLIEYLANNDRNILATNKLGSVVSTVTEHVNFLNNFKGGDPVVLGMSCLHNIQKIL